MKKIQSLFMRNYETDRLVRDEAVPGSEWVANGEGYASRKWDGTCCMVRGGRLFKRYDRKRKRGKLKAAPPGWEPCEDAPNEHTGHWPGWTPVGDGPEDRWHREAFSASRIQDGTYELCGPKIQGNPENFATHALVSHASRFVTEVPRDYDGLKEFFCGRDIEGIVWHHPDGRMVKIKARDFGIKR